jgi:hypothetical protein
MQPVRKEVGGAPRTVQHAEAVLDVFEEDGTRRKGFSGNGFIQKFGAENFSQ